MHMLTPYDIASSDCAMAVALLCAIGLLFLTAATDGHSVHGLGMLGKLTLKGRIIGLLGANGIFAAILLSCWIGKDITPVGVFHGATLWWSSDTSFVGKGIAIIVFWILLSPIQSVLTGILIIRAAQRS